MTEKKTREHSPFFYMFAGALSFYATQSFVEHREVARSIPDIVQEVNPGVVVIRTADKPRPLPELAVPEGFHMDTELPPTAFYKGAGFVVDPRGYIVTAYHVASSRDSEINVTLQDGKSFPAKIVGEDRELDLSLLKINAGYALPALALGNSDDLREGDMVIAVGHPYGFAYSVSSGIVSGLHRAAPDNAVPKDFIQFDAAVNPGNSGGPLFDKRGAVIGVVDSIQTQHGNRADGIAFAIPSAQVWQAVHDFILYGALTPGVLGFEARDHSGEVNANERETAPISVSDGALVVSVDPSSAAEKAGLRQGDIITAFDGKEVTSPNTIYLAEHRKHPGDSVSIVVRRAGKTVTLKGKMGGADDADQGKNAPTRTLLPHRHAQATALP